MKPNIGEGVLRFSPTEFGSCAQPDANYLPDRMISMSSPSQSRPLRAFATCTPSKPTFAPKEGERYSHLLKGQHSDFEESRTKIQAKVNVDNLTAAGSRSAAFRLELKEPDPKIIFLPCYDIVPRRRRASAHGS